MKTLSKISRFLGIGTSVLAEAAEADTVSGAPAAPEAATNDPAPNNKVQVHNLIILDESGSMGPLRDATISGINEVISGLRLAQEEFAATQQHTLTLVTFDSGGNRPPVRTIIDCQPIAEVADFTNYRPYGCTPLYDAMGMSIENLRQRMANDPTATAVVTVVTDGLENASCEWNADSLRKLIEQLKAEGWTFSYMGSAHNVRDVADLLSIDNAMSFAHDASSTKNSWARERSSKRAMYLKINEFVNEGFASDDDRREKLQWLSRQYYGNRVTPDRITALHPNEVFVFGSNSAGRHYGGAAAAAVAKFGAIMGRGEGLQGQSYAIPTMEGAAHFREAVERFIAFAAAHPELRFLVTRVGCGIAGYSVDEVAPFFRHAVGLENVCLPSDFWQVLGLEVLNQDFE